MAAPSASRRRPAPSRAKTNRTPRESPRHRTRSGRNSRAAPASSPATVQAAGAVPAGIEGARRRAHRPHREADAAHPGQGRHADRRDDDDGGDRAAQRGDVAAPPVPDDGHARDQQDELQQADHPLGPHRHAEHLEEAGDRPDAARAVEVQEVAVGDVALQEALGEHDHEPLLHRRTGSPEHAAEGDGDDDAHDDRGDEPAVAGEPGAETAARRGGVVGPGGSVLSPPVLSPSGRSSSGTSASPVGVGRRSAVVGGASRLRSRSRPSVAGSSVRASLVGSRAVVGHRATAAPAGRRAATRRTGAGGGP